MKAIYSQEPKQFETIRSIGIYTTVLRYDIVTLDPESDTTPESSASSPESAASAPESAAASIPSASVPDGFAVGPRYQCEEVEYCHRDPLSTDDRSALIAALIRSRYTADDVEAIQLNYLADPTEAHKTEFNTLSAFRTTCKSLVDAALAALCP